MTIIISCGVNCTAGDKTLCLTEKNPETGSENEAHTHTQLVFSSCSILTITIILTIIVTIQLQNDIEEDKSL